MENCLWLGYNFIFNIKNIGMDIFYMNNLRNLLGYDFNLLT